MPARLAQEELKRVRRRLHGRRDRGDDLGLRSGLLDDLDRALVELTQQRVVLELGQLVRLGDLREICSLNGSDLLGVLEQLPDVLDCEDGFDVDLAQGGEGPKAGVPTLSRPPLRV